MAFGLSAGAVSLIGMGAGALLGGGGSSQSGTQTTTQQQTLDPRIAAAIFGNGGTGADGGILGRNTALFDRQQDPMMQQYGTTMQHYLGNAGQDMGAMRQAAAGLMGGGIQAPQMQAGQMGNVPGMQASTFYSPQAMQTAQIGRVDPMQAAKVGPYGQATSQNMTAAQVNAPGQNNMNLSGAYDKFINQDAGANQYLTGAIQGGINQSQNAFSRMQDDSTRNLNENVLPGIRSNSVLSGQYGGSRQGIAEGRALGDFGREQQRAISEFGQHNTDAAVGAQAAAFDAGQNRSLSALQNLGGQQYGVASQNAGMQQQANASNQDAANAAGMANFNSGLTTSLANASNMQAAAQANLNSSQQMALQQAAMQQQTNGTNYGGLLTAAGTNAANQQGANATNYGGALQAAGTNATLQQGANTNNLQSQLGTNSLNSNNTQAGAGMLNGLLSTAATAGGNQDAYALNHAAQVNGLLGPYLGAGSGTTSSQPLYQNQGGNMLAGATAGLGIARQIGNLVNTNGNTSSGQGAYGAAPAGTYYDGYGYVNY